MTPTEAGLDHPPPVLELRPSVPADLAAIAGVYLRARRAAVPMMPPLPASESGSESGAASEFIRDGLTGLEIWVGVDHRGPVGFAAFTRTWLDHLYVLPEAQGAGVGAALLEVVKARLRDGFGLWAFESNSTARAFYRRHGLVEGEVTDGSQNPEGQREVRLDWRPGGRLR